MDFRTIFAPVRELYVPSGWTINKNNLFYVNKETLNNVNPDYERFLAEEFFIVDTIFYGKQELPVSTTKFLVCVVDAGCRLIDSEEFILQYEINLNVFLKIKNKLDNLINRTYSTTKPQHAAELLSDCMASFAHGDLIDLQTGAVLV